MSLKDHWRRYGKCIAAGIGGLGIGVITGASAGSAIPILGTVGCGIVGGISGLLAGTASAC